MLLQKVLPLFVFAATRVIQIPETPKVSAQAQAAGALNLFFAVAKLILQNIIAHPRLVAQLANLGMFASLIRYSLKVVRLNICCFLGTARRLGSVCVQSQPAQQLPFLRLLLSQARKCQDVDLHTLFECFTPQCLLAKDDRFCQVFHLLQLIHCWLLPYVRVGYFECLRALASWPSVDASESTLPANPSANLSTQQLRYIASRFDAINQLKRVLPNSGEPELAVLFSLAPLLIGQNPFQQLGEQILAALLLASFP